MCVIGVALQKYICLNFHIAPQWGGVQISYQTNFTFLVVGGGRGPVTHKDLQRETACLSKHKLNGVMQTHLQTWTWLNALWMFSQGEARTHVEISHSQKDLEHEIIWCKSVVLIKLF